ncbi:MAG: hypothetical protein ABIH70_04505 [Chloroflexota bacterium]
MNFIDTTMPLDGLASLSQQQYLDVLCYLLLQNKFAAADTAFDPNNLQSYSLTK